MAEAGEDDLATAELLDQMVECLQTEGPAAVRQRFADHLRNRPDLLPLLDCLTGVDSLGRTIADVLAEEEAAAPKGLPNHAPVDPEDPSTWRNPTVGRGSFGKYDLEEELGRGGMGVVYRAVQRDLGRVVALKMILAGHLADDEHIRRFYGEARAAGRLKHPHIVAVFEVGQYEHQHYFAMDYVAGASLARVLAYRRQAAAAHAPTVTYAMTDLTSPVASAVTDDDRLASLPTTLIRPPGAPDDATAAQVELRSLAYLGECLNDPLWVAERLAQVARAVDYLHQQQIVHRDLKPGNILLDWSGHPYVTDFGLAKLAQASDGLTRSGAIFGTPSYMAPEQARGDTAGVGPACDIYSLGAILYEILTGQPPFRADSPVETILRVLERDPVLPRQLNPKVPRDLERICLRCLEKDPQRRYGSAAELADDLQRYLQAEPVLARQTDLFAGCRRWIRREPGLAVRWGSQASFALMQTAWHLSGMPAAGDYWAILAILAVWAAVSWLCQRFLHSAGGRGPARALWITADITLLTAMLATGHGISSPMLITYAMLIAATGVWNDTRLVALTAALSCLGYAFLAWYAWFHQTADWHTLDYHIMMPVSLIMMALIVGYQVNRLRVLTRYAERRG